MNAFVFVRITFAASAPAPLTPAPAPRLKPAASEAAAAIARMLARLGRAEHDAAGVGGRRRVFAFLIDASTWFCDLVVRERDGDRERDAGEGADRGRDGGGAGERGDRRRVGRVQRDARAR